MQCTLPNLTYNGKTTVVNNPESGTVYKNYDRDTEDVIGLVLALL